MLDRLGPSFICNAEYNYLEMPEHVMECFLPNASDQPQKSSDNLLVEDLQKLTLEAKILSQQNNYSKNPPQQQHYPDEKLETVQQNSKKKQMQKKQKYSLAEKPQQSEEQDPADKEKQMEKQSPEEKRQQKKMQDPTYKVQQRELQKLSADEELQKLSADEELQKLSADEELQKLSADEELQELSVDKKKQEHSVNEEQRSHSADKEKRSHSADKEQQSHKEQKLKNINSVDKDLTYNQLYEKWSLENKAQYDYSGEDLKFEQLKVKFNKLFKNIAENVQQIDKFAHQQYEQVEYAKKLSVKKLFEKDSCAKNEQKPAYTATVEGISWKNRLQGSKKFSMDLEHFKKELYKIFTPFLDKRPEKDNHSADVEKISKHQDHSAYVELKSKNINSVEKDSTDNQLQQYNLDEKWSLKNKVQYDYFGEDLKFEQLKEKFNKLFNHISANVQQINQFAHERFEQVQYTKKLSEMDQPEEKKLFEEDGCSKNKQKYAYTENVERISWKNQPQSSKKISIDLEHFKKELDKIFTPSSDKRPKNDKNSADKEQQDHSADEQKKEWQDHFADVEQISERQGHFADVEQISERQEHYADVEQISERQDQFADVEQKPKQQDLSVDKEQKSKNRNSVEEDSTHNQLQPRYPEEWWSWKNKAQDYDDFVEKLEQLMKPLLQNFEEHHIPEN